MKKIVSAILSLIIAFSALPAVSVSAAEGIYEYNVAVVDFDADLAKGREQQNLSKIKNHLSNAIDEDAGINIVLFPEYALTSKKEDAIDVATNDSVAQIAVMTDEADIYAVFGSVIKENDKIYSAMIICDPNGGIDVYKKIHISDEQYEAGFSAGTKPYILNTDFGKFGIAMGNEFAEAAELGKYYIGKECVMILVAQSYGYDTTKENAFTQAEYDLYTATYTFLELYNIPVAVSNLYTKDSNVQYFGESHICTSHKAGWIVGGNNSDVDEYGQVVSTAPARTYRPGIKFSQTTLTNDGGRRKLASTIKRLNLSADWYGKLINYDMPVYGEESQYKDDVKAACVNYHSVWGDLDANVAKIKSIMADAAEQGVELLVFPEMALTGYCVVPPSEFTDYEKEKFGDEYMQRALAQTVRGDNPSDVIVELQQLAESYGMYVIVGLPEHDESEPDVYWESAAILGPNLRDSYRKVSLAGQEPRFASYGSSNEEGIFETEFGLIGVEICSDIYEFQEIQRTKSAKGCRIIINCTAAYAMDGWPVTFQNQFESYMLRDKSFMITANLVGYDGIKISEELEQQLAEAGYTIDDVTKEWSQSMNGDLFKLLCNSSGESLMNSYCTIFPGVSAISTLDPTTVTGTRAYGNSSESSSIEYFSHEHIGPYLDPDGDGKNEYINFTADTFDKMTVADLDLSKASLEPFYSDNPYKFRPELYYEWYSELFYESYFFEENISEVTYLKEKTLKNSKSLITGRMTDNTSLYTSTTQTNPVPLDGYNVTSSLKYKFLFGSNVTTDLIYTGSMNTIFGETTKKYTAQYAPIVGEITLKIPVGICDKAVLYAGDKKFESNGTIITATLPSYTDLNDIRVVIYDDPETEQPIGGPTGSGCSTYWIYDPDTKTLTVTGEGTMSFFYDYMKDDPLSAPYSTADDVPWADYREEIENVVIENGVTNIANKAFYGCKNLKSISISDTVTSIGESAFDGCVSLEEIKIPNSVEAIYDNAFYFCTSLKSVDIPSSVQKLGLTVFNNCKNLESINVGEDNPSYMSIDGVLYNKDLSLLIQYPCNKTGESFEISDTVTEIGEGSFKYCSNLKSVTIPQTVTTISNYAFEGCTNLENIVVPNSVSNLGEWAFFQCSNLKSVVLPDGITSLGEYTFYKCESLEKVTIPESVETIGKYAFKECSSLKNITLPSKLSELGLAAFESCTSLSSIVLPDSLTKIEGFVFNGCTNLKYIAVPDTITKVGDWAFRNCVELKNVFFTGDENHWNNIVSGESNELFFDADCKYNCKSYDFSAVNEDTINMPCDGKIKYIAFIADSTGTVTVNTTSGEEIIAEISDSEGNVLAVEESEALLSSKLTEGNLYIISVKNSEISENTFDINISFVSDSLNKGVVGDVNSDGSITVEDATLIQKYLVGLVNLPENTLSAADCNNDSVISVLDASEIQKYITDTSDNNYIGQPIID